MTRQIVEIPANKCDKQEKQTLRVAAYCRVSTDHEEQLSSLHNQAEYYKQLIRETPNWIDAGVFCDIGSGRNLKKRSEFQKLIQKCRRGKVDLIVTKSISRFARNTLDALRTLQLLSTLDAQLDNKKDWILRMTLGYRIANLYYLSHEWIDERLAVVFSDVNPIAISIGYIMGRRWTQELYKYLSDRNYLREVLSVRDDASTFISQIKCNIAAISIRALIDDDDVLGGKESTLNSVISNLTDSILIEAMNVFKSDITNIDMDDVQRESVGSKLSAFLEVITINAAWKNNYWFNSLIDCIASLRIITDDLWNSTEKLIRNAGDIWVGDRIYQSLEKTVTSYPLRTARLMEVLIDVNARTYLTDNTQKVISGLLSTVESNGYGVEPLRIRNKHIAKGYTSFAAV